MVIATKPKTTASATVGGKPLLPSRVAGSQLEDDRMKEEAARRLIQEGAGGRTLAAETAADRFRGLEKQQMARASQAAGQLMAQATGGASGGAVLAAGQEAGRQAASQYADISGRAAKDIFAAESAAGERRMDEAEVMKGTTLSSERSAKRAVASQTYGELLSEMDAGTMTDDQAAAILQGHADSESDPSVSAYYRSLIAQLKG